jgi:hypothetical protein
MPFQTHFKLKSNQDKVIDYRMPERQGLLSFQQPTEAKTPAFSKRNPILRLYWSGKD